LETLQFDEQALLRAPCELVPVSSLWLGDSPRTGGIDDEYAHALAELDTDLPPIIVHRPTMRVIDGAHRLRAAHLNAREYIEAQMFGGGESDAFVLAVRANTANGLPLSLADRKAAAARIVRTDPARSDRWIAMVSGLTAATVGAIRRCSTDEGAQSNTRIGRDLRLRPLDSSAGRRLAEELIRANPNRSLRDIARAAGIAPSTVLDVRNRLAQGEDPVPARRKDAAHIEKPDAGTGQRRRQMPAGTEPDRDPAATVGMLCKDPSLRLNDAGRALLHWLKIHTVADQAAVPSVDNIPGHCLGTIAALARGNGRFWMGFGEQLEEELRNRWPGDSGAEDTRVAQ